MVMRPRPEIVSGRLGIRFIQDELGLRPKQTNRIKRVLRKFARILRSTSRSIPLKASRDRHAHCRQMFRADVACSRKWKPFDGVAYDCTFARCRYHRLAAGGTAARQAGLHFPRCKGCAVCGRLLLARVSAPQSHAENSSRFLDDKNYGQHVARPRRDTRVTRVGMARAAGMGMRAYHQPTGRNYATHRARP